MAVIAKQRYKLDITPQGGWVIIYASQHDDEAREIEFEIINQGKVFSIPASINVSVQGIKSNGGYFSHSCSYSGNIVTMALADDMTDVTGKAICVLKFTNQSNQKLATAKFVLNVDTDASSEGVIIDTEAEEIFNQMLNDIRAQAASVSADIAELQSMVGSPLVASTVSAMTNHNKIYVYVGSESGYTNGNWYYWNGSAWTSGGVYNSAAVNTDKTLSVENMPADAKETGDKINGLKEDITVAVNITPNWESVSLTLQNGYYVKNTGQYYEEADRRSAKINVNVGAKYKLSTYTRSALISGIMFFDSNDVVVGTLLDGTGTETVITNYEFTIPAGVASMAVQSGDATRAIPILYVYEEEKEFVGYTKTEVDEKISTIPTIDPTLAQAGRAADAKVVGDEITSLKSGLTSLENFTTISETVDEPVTLAIQNGYYVTDGRYIAEGNRGSAIVEQVNTGEKYKISCSLGSTIIYGVLFLNNGSVTSAIMQGTGTPIDYTDYEFIIPDDCDSIIVQTAYSERVQVSLKKVITRHIFKAYTKSETDNLISNVVPKKYGIKWEISNADDLGQRCFDAIGLTASIGIGSTNGQSDFDTIYPWSEIKRCNIKQNANGAKIVTFEGETGFALDGSNGDVFVRIPKFYYERYQEDGYEYRVISAIGTNPHPVFIEDEKVLDEIFVGAFEGNIESSKLRSIGGVIPSSNEIAQTFLDAAQANGDGYTLYDMRTVDAVWTLMAVEFGCRNTNQIIGYGFADFLQPVSGTYGVDYDGEATTANVFTCSASLSAFTMNMLLIGSNVNICKENQLNVIATRKLTAKTSDSSHYYLTFDGPPVALDSTCFIGSAACTTNFCETVETGALSWHTGRANWVSGSTTKNPVRYRWIENIVGSLWAFLPDITFNNLQMYFCKDISKYEMGSISDGYSPVGDLFPEQKSNGYKGDVTDVNYWITDLANISFGRGINFGKSWNTSLISTKAFGGFYYLDTGLRVIANGGGFDHLYRCNMLTNRAWIKLDSKWYLYGCRLIYKHIN